MKKGQIAILLAVIVLCVGGIFGYVKYKSNDDIKPEENKEQNVESKEEKNGTKEPSGEMPETKNELPANDEQVKSIPMKGNDDRTTWKKEAKRNSNVVTVIGTTWCPNCQVFEPIMQEVKDEYNLNVYFFKVDLLFQEDYNDLINTFALTGYDSSIPYTAVINEGKVTAYHTGRMTKEALVDFLKESNVIK